MASAFASTVNGIVIVQVLSISSTPVQPGVLLGRLRLPTDPIGATTVAFEGVQPGSEIHVYLPDGTEVAGVESCAANQELAWPVYAPGSVNNTVSITIIKRGLRWQKFTYASKLGAQSIPIFPQPDLGYNNPA